MLLNSSAFSKPLSNLVPPPVEINSVLKNSELFTHLMERVRANTIDLHTFCRTVPGLFFEKKDLPATFLILAVDAAARNAIRDALTFMEQIDPLPNSKPKDLHYEHFLVNLGKIDDQEGMREAVARSMTKISDPDIQKRTFHALFESAKESGKVDAVVEIVEKTRSVPRYLNVGNEALKVLYEVLVGGFNVALKNKEAGGERIVEVMNRAVPNPKNRNSLFQRMSELFNRETRNVSALLFVIKNISDDEPLQNRLLRAISPKAAISDEIDAFLNAVEAAISGLKEKNQIIAQFSVDVGFHQNFSKAMVVREHISDLKLKNNAVHWFCSERAKSGDIKTALETLYAYVPNLEERAPILKSLTEAITKLPVKISLSSVEAIPSDPLKSVALGIISSVLKEVEDVAKFLELVETLSDLRAQIKLLRQACNGLLKNGETDRALDLAKIVLEKLDSLTHCD